MKIFFALLLLFFSNSSMSQTILNSDSLIDFSNRTDVQQILKIQLEKNRKNSISILIIVDSIPIKKEENLTFLRKLDSTKIKDLIILENYEEIKNYTLDKKIKKVFVVKTI